MKFKYCYDEVKATVKAYLPDSDIKKQVLSALDKVERSKRYRWHDLEKDPKDLPEANGLYLTRYQSIKSGNRGYALNYYFDFEDGWFDVKDRPVLAWKRIEPMMGDAE